MLGPVIGGLIVHYLHWRVIFLVLATYGLAMLAWSWLRLPETLPVDKRRPLSFKAESESPFRDTVVTLLLDNSGSMRGRPIMVAAVVIALGVMLAFAGVISDFVNRHPTLKMLALSFLILIGVTLIGEGLNETMNPSLRKRRLSKVDMPAWEETSK